MNKYIFIYVFIYIYIYIYLCIYPCICILLNTSMVVEHEHAFPERTSLRSRAPAGGQRLGSGSAPCCGSFNMFVFANMFVFDRHARV